MSWVIFFIRFNGAVFLGYGLFARLLPRNRLIGVRFSYTLADGEIWRAVQGKARWPVLALGVPCVLLPRSTTLLELLVFAPVLSGSWSWWLPAVTVMRNAFTRPSMGRPTSRRRAGSGTSRREKQKAGHSAGSAAAT